MRRLCRLYNGGGNSVRNMMVTSVPSVSHHLYTNDLSHPDLDLAVGAQLSLVENHALALVTVAPWEDVPEVPRGMDSRKIGMLREKMYLVDEWDEGCGG